MVQRVRHPQYFCIYSSARLVGVFLALNVIQAIQFQPRRFSISACLFSLSFLDFYQHAYLHQMSFLYHPCLFFSNFFIYFSFSGSFSHHPDHDFLYRLYAFFPFCLP